MTSDLDIYRSASVLIRQHGAGAGLGAVQRAVAALQHCVGVFTQDAAFVIAFEMVTPRRPAATAMPNAITTISAPYSLPIEPRSSPQKRDKNLLAFLIFKIPRTLKLLFIIAQIRSKCDRFFEV